LAAIQSGLINQASLAILWIDIDRFHQINASFGHAVGDSILVEVTRRITRLCSKDDVICRVNGDEFVIVKLDFDGPNAIELAQRILDALNQPLGIGTIHHRPVSSIGIATATVAEQPHDLLEQAERAKNASKVAGGNRATLSDDSQRLIRYHRSLAREEIAIEDHLHYALDHGGLYLEYQPIVDIHTELPIALEALMRCKVDDRTISPAHFIPVAEKTGLIQHLGEWGMGTAINYAKCLLDNQFDIRIAVNISRAQLLLPSFFPTLHAVFAFITVPPDQIELEITESLFMDANTEVMKNVERLGEIGCHLVIDDFGTGYSSLAVLKDLPVSKLKLDRAFVKDLPEDKRSLSIIRAIVALANEMDIMVVAEGVEKIEQFNCLREAGVHSIQGYYISRSLSDVEMLTWLRKRLR
jgi:diguanylate cyclase (GGDEF)-like protein